MNGPTIGMTTKSRIMIRLAIARLSWRKRRIESWKGVGECFCSGETPDSIGSAVVMTSSASIGLAAVPGVIKPVEARCVFWSFVSIEFCLLFGFDTWINHSIENVRNQIPDHDGNSAQYDG